MWTHDAIIYIYDYIMCPILQLTLLDVRFQ